MPRSTFNLKLELVKLQLTQSYEGYDDINSVWSTIRTDFKTFNNVCENAFKRCCLYPPLIPIYDSDGDIKPELLLDANIKLLEKYQNLAITSSHFIFDIKDLIRLQKIVSAQPNTPTRQTIAYNTVVLVNAEHIRQLDSAFWLPQQPDAKWCILKLSTS